MTVLGVARLVLLLAILGLVTICIDHGIKSYMVDRTVNME